MQKRIDWIDYSKAFSIFLVVLGHSFIPLSAKSIIYVFHIPLFFFISGLLFSFEKYSNYTSFLKKRVFQLLIPYLFFNVITYIFWFFVGRKVGADIHLALNPLKPLLGILYGNDAGHYLEHCAPLWFLTCLFSVENLYYLIFKRIKHSALKIVGLIVIGIIGYIDYSYNPIRFPWGLNVAIVMLVFYGLGSLFRSKILNNNSLHLMAWLILSFISLGVVLFIAQINGKVEVSVDYFGNYFYFLIGAFAGIIFVISLTKILEILFGSLKPIQFIGKNTLIIFALHILAGTFIKGISYYLMGLPLSIFEFGWVALLYSILSIIILIPAILIINKYLPFVIGKSKI